MEFKTPFNPPKVEPKDFSNTKMPIYKKVYDKNGNKHLEVESQIDIYEKIQEYREETKIENLMNKYGLDHIKMMEQSEDEFGQLVDTVGAPKTLMEMAQEVENAQNLFEHQGKEFKEKFGNSFKKFLASADNGKLTQIINDMKPKQENELPVQPAVQPIKPVQPAVQPIQPIQETQLAQPVQLNQQISQGGGIKYEL